MIRVLMQNRQTMFDRPGGDSVQLLKTKEYLEKINVAVDISIDLEPDLRKYDLVHLFHLDHVPDENYIRFLNAKKQNKPVVLSPIYWRVSEVGSRRGLANTINFSLPNGTLRRISSQIYNHDFGRNNVDLVLKCFRLDFRGVIKKVLESCNAVLPNAKIEGEKIKKDFELKDTNKFYVVPNGVDIHSSRLECGCFNILGKPAKDFVLCVGRIEDRKNQLALIKALRGTGLKLVLIGGCTTKSKSNYYNLCKKAADKNVTFIDWMNNESLALAYHAAKVHVLPSWFETPGLVNLEAGLAGCNIVATDKGSTKEYLRDYAWYCDPSKIASIRHAVLDAFSAEKNPDLRKFILTNFSWEQAAEKTLKVYEKVLMRNS